ncbi:MAG: hypothetical protein H2058_16545 [Muricauda sp.]|nr:hypothetical protein [Allomuricauda sp.]MBA4746854.1 hypothetical protein [Allomuricauda sp.]
MKYVKIFTALLLFIVSINKCEAYEKQTNPEFKLDSTYFFKANPKEGFNFGYYIYLPKGLDFNNINTLLVESSNTGASDSIFDHLRNAKQAASKSSLGNYVSRKLKTPLLVPVFPRSKTNWKIYTHAFDSDTFNQKNNNIERIDLQLLHMVKNARKELIKMGINIDDRFFMTGFSASGTFANRFSMLHPEKLKAVAAGGLNGLLIAPKNKIENDILKFPIGIADVYSVTGIKPSIDTFKKLPQLWFMGELDTNDAVLYDDGYSITERALVYKVLGQEMMPTRWHNSIEIYEKSGIPAIMKTYKNIGHGTDKKINDEITEFFRKHH